MPNDEIFPVDESDDDVMVTVETADGVNIPCEILTIFEVNGQDYIALLPTDNEGGPNTEGLVYLYRYAEDADGTPSIDNIQDDEEYEIVEGTFNKLLDDAFENT